MRYNILATKCPNTILPHQLTEAKEADQNILPEARSEYTIRSPSKKNNNNDDSDDKDTYDM